VSDLITRTARLVPYAKRPKQVPSFVTAYSYEPLANETGAELGSLYVVMEVLVSGRASEEVADLIIETIGEHYYNDTKLPVEALTRFEAAIKATNQELGEHVNRGNAAWIGKLSAIIAVQAGAELHIAQTGSAEAFLYRGKSATHITPASASRPATPTKTFGSIASGQLEPGDRLLLATPALIHQVPLTRLQSVISESGPNTAISEVTKLLRGTSTDRIAALIIEATTPELAALQVRSEEPSEIQLGLPENPVEAAKMVAAPFAQTTMASGKKVVTIAGTGLKRARPHAKALGLAITGQIRRLLSTKTGRQRALAGLIIVAVTLVAFAWYHNSISSGTKVFNRYQQAYQTFQQGEQLLANGNKSDARQTFQQVQAQLADLKPHQNAINSRLEHTTLPENEPRTLTAFTSLVSDRIDQIDGLTKVDATTIASITSKNAKLTQLQLVGSNAYVFDSGNGNMLSIINITTGSIKTSSADTSKIGNVISTTISGNSDGIYVLTDKPSIWFYRFDNDTMTEQKIAFGQWPPASAVASYTSNIYLLGDTTVYKHTKNATGFSPKTDYLPTSGEEAKGSTALAIDGAVYLLSPSGLHRYLSGTLKQSAPNPDSLAEATDLQIGADGSRIIATSGKTKRIGLWSFKNDALTFTKQIAPRNVKTLSGANYEAKTGNLFALADNRLIKIPLNP
jgi:hypothetical protein